MPVDANSMGKCFHFFTLLGILAKNATYAVKT